jgi:predicted amidohydrolase YtcJ
MALVASPPWTSSQLESYLDTAVQDVLKVGLTSVHDAAALPEYIETFAKYVLSYRRLIFASQHSQGSQTRVACRLVLSSLYYSCFD